MIGLGLILMPVLSSLLVGVSLRLKSLVATALASYVAFVANLALVTQVLSPFREVTRGFLALSELALLAAAAAAFWLLGRPRPPLGAARRALAEVASDRVTLLYLAALAVLLGYELLLALSVPPDNLDSLSYHLARVAAWYHHGGIYWVANPSTARINEFQPLAEQQIYFLFVATGSALLYALPQYLAQLAILVAVFGAARRLGYGARPAACSACLFATFGLVAYEATTAQNDLVAASLPAAAACLLLGGGRVEVLLAGLAAGIGLGVKLTTVLIWPVLLALALLRGRKALLLAAIGATLGLLAIGSWSFVLNLAHTGQLLGAGGGRLADTTSPSYPGSLVTLLSILYATMDLSVLWPAAIVGLAVVGVGVAVARGWRPFRGGDLRTAALESAEIAVPFAAPVLVLLGAATLAYATGALGHPLRGPHGSYSTLGFFGGLNNTADENASAFGPLGGAVLVGVPVLTAIATIVRKGDRRLLVLAAALPSFLILLALGSNFNPWLSRFLIVPAAVTAPLLARLFRGRAISAAYLVVSLFVIALGITRLHTKRLVSSFGVPWQLTQAAALAESGQGETARALALYDAAVPAHAEVGALLSEGDPSYLLGGPELGRRVTYLPLAGAQPEAARLRLRYVVIIDQPPQQAVAAKFKAAGWSIHDLVGYWLLALAPPRRL